MNALTNAVKYGSSAREPIVNVNAALGADGGLVIDVLDRGRGL